MPASLQIAQLLTNRFFPINWQAVTMTFSIRCRRKDSSMNRLRPFQPWLVFCKWCARPVPFGNCKFTKRFSQRGHVLGHNLVVGKSIRVTDD